MSLNELERGLINRYQGGFPLEEQPYRQLAAELDSSASTVLETIENLLATGTLSRFGPLYDAVRLGGGLTLAALSVPEDQYQDITAVVNGYPEVAHNYRREHQFNMWFVLATESTEDIGATLKHIEQSTGLVVYNFPKLHEFYVGLWLHLDSENHVTTVPIPAEIETSTASAAADHCRIDGLDRKIIQATQAGLPLVGHPYQAIAEQCDCIPEAVRQRLEHMLNCGIIRRVGLVPNHYRLGLKANGMTVWDVPDETAMEIGQQIGQLDFVSHCYLRPRHLPVWRYNLFAMVHGHTQDEVEAKIQQIENRLGEHCDAHETLYSTAILKKSGMRLAA